MKVFILFFALLISCQNSEIPSPHLSKKIIKKIYPGIVEVVIPKVEDKDIVYERPLPFDRQDFHIRNDKFHSIGTAFFIGPKKLLSAAHVFGLDQHNQNSKFFVRNKDGKVFKVKNIFRYSQYRDLIEFDLESYPKNYNVLQSTNKVEIGDMVYAVGNALGQGISTRGGQLSNFTPEHVNGQWDFLRFSSPASPGNSGGPLVNAKGKVVGVIVMKNNSENLNYALPIAERSKTSLENADFFLRNQRVQDGIVVTTKDWKEAIPLPNSPQEIQNLISPKKNQFFVNLINDFKIKNEPKLFPSHPRYRQYLRTQDLPLYSGNIDKNANLYDWKIKAQNFSKLYLDNSQRVHHGKGMIFPHILLIEKPNGKNLKDFNSDNESIMRSVLKVLGANRSMAGERIPILSYGEKPDNSRTWKDGLGRHWTSIRYDIRFNNTFLAIHHTPTPKGVFCLVELDWYFRLNEGYSHFLEENILEVPISYFGKPTEWKNFFELPSDILPDYFQNHELRISKKGLIFKSSEFQFDLANFPISEKSQLVIRVGYDPEKKLALKPMSWLFRKDKTQKDGFHISAKYSPSIRGAEEPIHDWKDFKAKKNLYSGKVESKGGIQRVTTPLAPISQIEDPVMESWYESTKSNDREELEKSLILICFTEDTAKKKWVRNLCKSLKKGFRLKK